MPSSVITSFKYKPAAHILRITFVSGKVYDYKNVPGDVFNEMKNSASKGTYFNKDIKGKYSFKKVN